jgi:hypothetical protein
LIMELMSSREVPMVNTFGTCVPEMGQATTYVMISMEQEVRHG